MKAANDLVLWDVPFGESRYPSLSLITEEGGDVAMLVVAPSGLDTYPKFLVRFPRVITLLCYEEAYAFNRGYRELTGIDSNRCAYLWTDSPWLQCYRKGREVFAWTDLWHYLIFGGDSIVEVIAAVQPTVERIEENRVIVTKHEV